MADVTLYHHPGCSKSRGALEILRERGVEPRVVEYLKRPLERAELEAVLRALSDEPTELVRKDRRFAELGLDASEYRSAEAVIGLLLEHPELMQRPVVVRGERAVIGRPPEKALELL